MSESLRSIRIGDFAEIRHGYAFESQFFSDKPTDYILLSPGNFHVDQRLYFGSNTKYFTGEISPDYVLENGDLVLVMTDLTKEMNILGNAVIIQSDKKVLHNQRIGKILITVPDLVDKTFLMFMLNSNLVRDWVKATASGTTVRHTAPSRILSIEIPLFPLPEQRKIAAILSTWDEAIGLTEALIGALERRKQALMQLLLTGAVRFQEFEGEAWEEVELGEVATVRRGASPRPIKDPKWFSETGRAWIRIADVTASPTRFLNEASQYLSPLGEERSVKIEVGELIMSIAASIGIPKIVNIPACIHDGFIVLRDYENHALKEFLYHYLNWMTKRLANSGQPGTQKNLNSDLVREISIPQLKLTEQEKIASLLTESEEEIYIMGLIVEQLQTQKRGLMQQLLTGAVRVGV